MPIDSYGRIIDRLRISVTQKCNFRCIYCHREGELYAHREYEITPSDIEKIVRVSARLGFKKVKLTGGEPLVRKDIVDIVKHISKIDGITEVSLTTNGSLLSDYVKELKDAGLTRANITLPTLNSLKFRYITGVNGLEKVLEGIERAIEIGLESVKINVPVLKNLNEKDVWNIIDYARKKGLNVQLIEYHDLDPKSENFRKFHVSLGGIVEKLEKISINKLKRELQSRPIYVLDGGVKVEIVEPMFNPFFCMKCKKLRVTSDGKLKPCFFRNDNLIDISHILNGLYRGNPEKGIEKMLLKAIMLKEPFFK